MKNLDKLVTFFISLKVTWKIDEFNHVIVWQETSTSNCFNLELILIPSACLRINSDNFFRFDSLFIRLFSFTF